MSNSGVTFYHATCRDLCVGQVINGVATTFYPSVVAALEAERPPGAPCRSKCVFAADSVAAAALYLSHQPGVDQSQIRIYQVEMPAFHRSPFRLIHEIEDRLKGDRDVSRLVSEYWSPVLDWAFFEYFGPSFQVVKEGIQRNSSEESLLKVRYQFKDYDQSQRL